jgi:hypothetical protein
MVEGIRMGNRSLKLVLEQFEDLFSKFNTLLFNGQLENPVITCSPDTTRGAYGWCTCWKAWVNGDGDGTEGYYEINMCAEHLNRPFENICGTLIHEMVHLLNLQNGVQDTSRSGKYHNKKFKEIAEQHGLIIEKDAKYGWCRTSLNEKGLEVVNSLNGQAFSLVRIKDGKGTGKTNKSKKYVCPCCNIKVRATKEVYILCGDCGVALELVE